MNMGAGHGGARDPHPRTKVREDAHDYEWVWELGLPEGFRRRPWAQGFLGTATFRRENPKRPNARDSAPGRLLQPFVDGARALSILMAAAAGGRGRGAQRAGAAKALGAGSGCCGRARAVDGHDVRTEPPPRGPLRYGSTLLRSAFSAIGTPSRTSFPGASCSRSGGRPPFRGYSRSGLLQICTARR